MLSIKVPASTSNIASGFDVMGLALNLYLEVEVKSGNNKFDFTGEGADILANDRNLLLRSYKDIAIKYTGSIPDYSMTVRNAIPFSSGLGSSAAAIVAGVMCADYLCDLNLPREELIAEAIMIEGHPDNVTPALVGGLTASIKTTKKREIYRKFRLHDSYLMFYAHPDYEVSTEKARIALPAQYAKEDVLFTLQRSVLLLEALTSGDKELLRDVLNDRIHEPYRAELVPGLSDVLSISRQNGLDGIFISGSGPTVGIFYSENRERIEEEIRSIFSKNGTNVNIYDLKPDNKGTITDEIDE